MKTNLTQNDRYRKFQITPDFAQNLPFSVTVIEDNYKAAAKQNVHELRIQYTERFLSTDDTHTAAEKARQLAAALLRAAKVAEDWESLPLAYTHSQPA